MKQNPKVSIITVNFNGESFTRELLLSLRNISYKNIETWVVDNASENPPKQLEAEFPEVKFLYSNKNLGFAGGNNLAIAQATGDILFYLNNDTEVEANFLEPVLELFLGNPRIGIVTSKLIYFDKPDTLQFAGSRGMNEINGRAFAIGWKEKDSSKYDTNYKTELAHGAAMAVSREVIDSIGMMCEDYFLYYEEVDFCSMAKKAGFEIWYCGASRVYHKESMSTGKNSTLKIYYLNRNRMLYIRRNVRGIKKWLALSHFLFLAVPKNLLKLLAEGNLDGFKAIFRGIFWNLSRPNIHKQLK